MKGITGTVNWGIIGCGDVCEVKSGPAFNLVPNSRLAAVMRRDGAKAEDFAKRHGVPSFYSTAEELIGDKNVNAIYIATPPAHHESFTHEALKAGKPVYVEKPVTTNANSCERMVKMEMEHDGKVSVAHYRRALPIFQKVKELVHGGRIGRVRLIRIATLQPADSKIITQTSDNWRVKPELSGGGLFHDLSPHQLDIMYWIFGSPKEASGRSLNQAKHYNAPDVSTLEVVFRDDVCLSGVWAFNVAESAAEDSCEIVGDEGKLRFSFFRKSTIEITASGGTDQLEFDYPKHIQQPMIEAVTKFFRDEGPNPCSLEESLVVMRLIDKTRN